MDNCMELIFKTNSEVELYQDLDGSYISTNPAEVLCSIFEDNEVRKELSHYPTLLRVVL